MKLRCKSCNQTKKVHAIKDIACDRKDCQLKHPGENQVLSFQNVKDIAPTTQILEFFETPEVKPSVIAANDHPMIPDPHKGEFPYDV